MADNPRLEELRRRIQKDPASIVFAQLAEEHRRVGNFQHAVQVARDGLAQHPSYLSARVTLGRALMELGEHDAAQRELEQVLRVAPDNLAAIRALAEIHQRRGELGEAARQFTTALDVARSELVLPDLAELSITDLPVPTLPALPPFPADRELQLSLDSIDFDLPPIDVQSREPVEYDPALDELEAWLERIVADRAARV